jgi:hypothetical protein
LLQTRANSVGYKFASGTMITDITVRITLSQEQDVKYVVVEPSFQHITCDAGGFIMISRVCDGLWLRCNIPAHYRRL